MAEPLSSPAPEPAPVASPSTTAVTPASAPVRDVKLWLLVALSAYVGGGVLQAAFQMFGNPRGVAGTLHQAFASQPWRAWAFGLALLVVTSGGASGTTLPDGLRADLRRALSSWTVLALMALGFVLTSQAGAHLLIPLAAVALSVPVTVAVARSPLVDLRLLSLPWVPWVAGGLSSLWYFVVSYTRHAHFGSGSRDMGLFLQSVWLLSRGKSPQNTVMGMNAFGDHMEFIDVLVAPTLWLWSDAGMLLLVQALCAGLGAVPVFRLARDRLGSPLAGVLASTAYFLSYEIANGVQFDWNPTTLSLGFFPWAIEAALQQRYRRMAVFLVLIGLCKENLLLYVGGFGAMLLVAGAPRRVALSALLIPAVAFLVEVKVIFPLFRDGGFRHFYFKDLGTDFTEVAVNALQSPLRVFALLFNNPQKLHGLLLPLTSTAFLPLLAPTTLLPALPGVMERFAGTFMNSWWGHHYGGPTHAVAVCSAILGGARLSAWLRARPSVESGGWLPRAASLWPAVLLLASTSLADIVGPWGPTDLFVLRKPYHPSVEDRQTMQAAVQSIPDGVAVAAQNYLLAHLADREKAFELSRAREAEYVAMTPTTNPWPFDRGYHDRLAQELLAEGWRIHFCQGNSFVLAREQGPSVPCPALGR
ncbi:MAG: DUF2079 domain-containing protein [Myxococcota bacterium]